MENSQQIIYFLLVLPIFVSALLFDAMIGKRLLRNPNFYLLLGIFTVATLLFDTYLTILPIVLYDPDKILGAYIGTIPVEDLVYGYALLLFALNSREIVKMLKFSYKKVLASSRPFSWINTVYPFVFSLLVLRGSITIVDVLLAIFFLFPYNLLVYGVNDIYDYDTDKINPRKNSIEGALVEPIHHKPIWWISISSCMLFLPLFYLAGGWLMVGVFSLGLLNAIFYSAPSLRLKGIPLLDSVSSSMHFVFPALVATVLANKFDEALYVLAAFFLWGIASHIVGAIPDIEFDKKAKISTVATFFGKYRAALIAGSFYIFSAVLLLMKEIPLVFVFLLIPYVLNCLTFVLEKKYLHFKAFRNFMYYNLVYGFASTIYIIFKQIN